MSRSFKRSPLDWDYQDLEDMVSRAVVRRQARRLAELAWGDAAIVDQSIPRASKLVRAGDPSGREFAPPNRVFSQRS